MSALYVCDGCDRRTAAAHTFDGAGLRPDWFCRKLEIVPGGPVALLHACRLEDCRQKVAAMTRPPELLTF